MEKHSLNILLSLYTIEDRTSPLQIECSCSISGFIPIKLKMYRTEVSQHFLPLFTKVKHWFIPQEVIRFPFSANSIRWKKYTLLQNKRGRWFSPPPPPHRSFENLWRNIDILYITLKGIVWRLRFSLNFSKIIWFRDFMSKISRNDSPMDLEWVSEKISNF